MFFGLLQTAKTILETGYGISFHFLHLTFQEYLAAIYVIKQISDQTSDYSTKLLELFLSDTRSGVIFRFICGMFFNEIEHKRFINIEPVISKIYSTIDWCHCMFEAKNDGLFDIFFDVEESYRSIPQVLTYYANSAHDFAAVLYVFANMPVTGRYNVEINFSDCGVTENQIKTLTDILAERNERLNVMEINLSGNKLTDKSVSDLFHRASTSFRLLNELNLEGNRIGSESITLLGGFNQLSRITLSDCPLGVSGMQRLGDAVCNGCLAGLKMLNLAGSLIPPDVNGALLATSLAAIMSHCHKPLSFDLSRNNLGVPGAAAIARVVFHKIDFVPPELDLPSDCESDYQRLVQDIYLDGTNLGDEGLIALIECSCNIDVCKLSLNGNDIHAAGILCLVEAVCAGKIVLGGTMSQLSLDNNFLGLEGTAAVGRMLSDNHCQFEGISLCKCHLTTSGSREAALSYASEQHYCKALCRWKQFYWRRYSYSCRLHATMSTFANPTVQSLWDHF